MRKFLSFGHGFPTYNIIYQNSPPYDSSIPQDWSLVPMMRPPLELQEFWALKPPFWMPCFVDQVDFFGISGNHFR